MGTPEAGIDKKLLDLLDYLVRRSANADISVTVAEATRRLGLKDQRITKRLIQSGDIRARKVRGGNTWLVSVDSLHAYIDGEHWNEPVRI